MQARRAKPWWPFGLLIAGALVAWALGYRIRDTGAMTVTAMLITVAGGYLVMVEHSKRR